MHTDIFYDHANKSKHKSGVVLTEKETTTLIDSKHNLGDWLLYQHFNKSFWQKVNSEPEFFEEVRREKNQWCQLGWMRRVEIEAK